MNRTHRETTRRGLARYLFPGRISGRSMLSSFVLVALAFGAASLVPATAATFSATTASVGNSGTSDSLNPPTSASASTGGVITVSWGATIDTYASGHRIFRATSPGGPYAQIAEVTPRATTSYGDSPAAGTYYYRVRAFHQSWESVDSNMATGNAVAVGLASTWQTGLAHTPGAGTNRALVFIASNEQQANTTPTLTGVSYGGQALTFVVSDQVTSGSKTASLEIWVLDEASLAAASGPVLVPTWTSAPDVALYSHVIFDNVDQGGLTGAIASGNAPADTPNPVPIAPVATSNLDMVVVGATAGEVGTYSPQNGFTLGVNQEGTIGGTSAQGTAHKTAIGSPETATMLFVPGAPPFINRQVVIATVFNVAP